MNTTIYNERRFLSEDGLSAVRATVQKLSFGSSYIDAAFELNDGGHSTYVDASVGSKEEVATSLARLDAVIEVLAGARTALASAALSTTFDDADSE